MALLSTSVLVFDILLLLLAPLLSASNFYAAFSLSWLIFSLGISIVILFIVTPTERVEGYTLNNIQVWLWLALFYGILLGVGAWGIYSLFNLGWTIVVLAIKAVGIILQEDEEDMIVVWML